MKKVLLLSIPFFSIVLSGCTPPEPIVVDALSGYETHTVKSGNLQETKQRIGTVKPVQEVILSPEVGGKITRFSVDIGDTVKQNEVLLKIDNDESSTQGAAAESMAKALESVKGSTAKLFDEQIDSMYHQLEIAKKQITIAKIAHAGKDTGKDDSLRILEQQKIAAEKTLEELKGVYDKREETILDNTENAFNQAYILTNEIINFADQILGVTTHHEHTNDAYERNLSARNTKLKSDAKTKLRILIKEKETLEAKFEQAKGIFKEADLIHGKGKKKIIALLEKSIGYMQDLEVFLKLMREIFDNSVVGNSLSSQMLAGQIKQGVNFQTKIEQVLLTADGENLMGLKGAKQMIEALQSTYDLEVTQASEQIKVLQKQVDATENGKSTEIEIADNQTEIAKDAYKTVQQQIEALKQQKSAKLAEVQSQIVMSRGQANQARVMAGNATVKAPFQGVVMERYVDQGAVVGPGVPLLKLGDTSEKIVDIRLPEQYRNLLKVGDSVAILAGKKEVKMKAKIKQIAPSADDMTKTVLVKVSLKEDIALGALVKVSIDIDEEKEVSEKRKQLVLPLSFIRYEYGDAYVWLWDHEKEKAEKQKIIVGKCGENTCEVKSGVKKGEILVRL